mgnify:CR=1 FL=1|tara:strand:- start:3043 stop:3762 length:720 start_codon:yes stop_codon:yes gene_type:complete
MKVIALMIGKKSSSGVPGKNISIVKNKRLCEYGLMAARESKYVNKIYVSTDCPTIIETAALYDAEVINRPPELHDPETLTEDVLSHAHGIIKQKESDFDFYVLLYANGGFVNGELLDSAIEKMMSEKSYDACVGAVSADMFTPIRAKRINENNELVPFIDLNHFGQITSNRDSAGNAFFIDLSLQVIKPRCFETMNGNQKPFLWLGNKIMPFVKDFGGDLDATWQYPVLEEWVSKNIEN